MCKKIVTFVILIVLVLFLVGVYMYKLRDTGSEWSAQVCKLLALKKSGAFFAKDKFGKEIILEWRQAEMMSKENAKTMLEVWEVVRDAYMPVEIKFLKTYPQVVGSDAAFKPYEPLFKNGLEKVDWRLVEETMQEVLKSSVVLDVSSLSDEIRKVLTESVHIFVFVSDKATGKKLGFIEFFIAPGYRYGDIKCTIFAVLPEEQNRGLGKLLMSTILKIVPQTKRIYLSTRMTNSIAQKAYEGWSFIKDENPVYQEGGYTFNKDHWMFFEYKTNQSDALQKAAERLLCK